jgi:hypothetical protein
MSGLLASVGAMSGRYDMERRWKFWRVPVLEHPPRVKPSPTRDIALMIIRT